jgi:hypothetical protein
MAFLYRMAGVSAGAPASPRFHDVGRDHAFYREIEWGVAEGITGGYADGSFRPAAAVSRQAMAAFLLRYDTNV